MSDLPAGWYVCSLGELGYWSSGGTPSRRDPDYFGGGIPWVKSGDLPDGPILHTDETISALGLANSAAKMMPINTICIALYGATIGKLGITTFKAATNQAVANLVPDEDLVRMKYVFYFLKSARQRFVELGQGGAQPNISQQIVRESNITIAPIKEQKRIADKLDVLLSRVDLCRERLDRVPAILKRFRQSVLAAATSGKLTEDWREEKGIVTAWKEVQLNEICDIQGGVTVDRKKQSLDDLEFSYLRVANVQRLFLNLAEIKTIRIPKAKVQQFLLKKGDVLFTEGGDIDKLGRGWVWEDQIENCSFQNHIFRARLNDSSNQPKYISWWGNYRGLEYFLQAGKQTTNLASINKSTLAALPVSLPSPEEQLEIVRRVETLFEQLSRIGSACAAGIVAVNLLTPSLLAKAFRGELVPQDPSDEPARKLLERIRAKRETAKHGKTVTKKRK